MKPWNGNVWWNWEQWKIVVKVFLTLYKKTGFFPKKSDTGVDVYTFVFISSFIVCVYAQYFFYGVRNQTWNKNQSTKVYQKKIRSSWKKCHVSVL